MLTLCTDLRRNSCCNRHLAINIFSVAREQRPRNGHAVLGAQVLAEVPRLCSGKEAFNGSTRSQGIVCVMNVVTEATGIGSAC
jgi:hypothetical protein